MDRVITVKYILKELMDPEILIKWCMDVGLIGDKNVCDKCGECMKLCLRNDVSDKYVWRCRKFGENGHDCKRSVRKNTWFERSKMCMNDILLVTHLWCMKATNEFIMKEVELAAHTVVDWKSFCREVCVELCMLENEMLGGPGMIVEIDESKFGKRKYNRGKHVDGRWVFGGIERGSSKCFMNVVNGRGKTELLAVIKKYIRAGTTIISDCWKSYDCLEDEGFGHLKVNHSIEFKNPENDAHTNGIEGTWSAIKRQLPTHISAGDDQFTSYLCEYVWRRKHARDADLTRTFLNGVKTIYPQMDYSEN